MELIINATALRILDWQVQTGVLTFNDRWANIIGYTVDKWQPIQFGICSRNFHLGDLKKAKNLLTQYFLLHYQPKVNMWTGTVVGVEALILWKNPERGLLRPIDFLPILEKNSINIEVGE